MGYFVYVLESLTNNKIYIGQTENLERRLAEHNDPENTLSFYTKRVRGPWKIIYSEAVETRSDSVRREKFLKSGQGREFIKRFRSDSFRGIRRRRTAEN